MAKNTAKEEGILTILDSKGDLMGVVYLNQNRDRVFYRVDKMGDDDIISLINDTSYAIGNSESLA